MLNNDEAAAQAQTLYEFHESEREPLNTTRRYWRGRQALPGVIPTAAPNEVHEMARMARVNICQIVVDTLAQSLFVDGFRAKDKADNSDIWDVWQANKLDARQTGIHRAALAYGSSYAVVLPGDPQPVIYGASPRSLTAVYGDDQDWPMWALERRGAHAPDGKQLWRLFDETAIYYLSSDRDGNTGWEFVTSEEHGLGVTPVIRYLDEDDLDADDEVEFDYRGRDRRRRIEDYTPTRGQIAPLFPLQDQIDLTTFNLLVAQHYAAFRQRYIIGWTADSEAEKAKAAASILWTFDKDKDEMEIGELSETNLKGYIDSREASLRHAATLSQTPVHELTGQLINMAAEALAAAEAGKDRKVDERKALMGESHEQTLWAAGQFADIEVPDDAQVVWRDTSARAFAATVDALGKLAQMLGVPPQELWERIPGVSQQDVERWKAEAESGDGFQMLAAQLEQQAAPAAANGQPPPVPTPPAPAPAA